MNKTSATTKMPANPAFNRAMQEIARSNAAVPHKNRKRYDRKRQNWKRDF